MRYEGTDDDLYLNILCPTYTSFKERSWPIKFTMGARPVLKRQAQVLSDSSTNEENKIKYEKEERPERIFNAKWFEGRP